MLLVDLPEDRASWSAHGSVAALRRNEELLFKALVLGTRDYCRKTGFKTAVLGISGGIDSAVVAAIGAAALGAENVTGLAMPSKYSSEHSKTDAYELARAAGDPESLTVPIEEPVTGFRQVDRSAVAGMELASWGEAAGPDGGESAVAGARDDADGVLEPDGARSC